MLQESLIEAISIMLTLECVLSIFVGVIIGVVFGAIPGLNTTMAIALAIPFTYSMTIFPSIALLIGIYMGGMAGGLITAILLKIPGTAASAATVFDGYPMTKKGRAAEALSLGIFASFFGGILSLVVLVAVGPPLARIALAFGPWEYFGTTFLALVIICLLLPGDKIKSFITMCIGLLLATIGISPVDNMEVRFTFGNRALFAGVQLIVVIIGIFALPEILNAVGELKTKLKVEKIDKKKIFYVPPGKQIKEQLPNLFRSSIIGTIIGILPGMGAGPATLISYAQARKFSKTPDEFGKGCPDGVVATEAANNAVTGGALVPLLSLGVPGDAITAVILGALTIQGITVGPMLLKNQPVVFIAFFIAALLANIAMFLVLATNVRIISKIIQIPRPYLLPIIMMFCITGTIAANNRVFDVQVLFILGIIGYILDKNNYPLAPMLMGFILSGTVESYFRRSIMYYDNLLNAMSRISVGTLFVIAAILLLILTPIISHINAKKIKGGKVI